MQSTISIIKDIESKIDKLDTWKRRGKKMVSDVEWSMEYRYNELSLGGKWYFTVVFLYGSEIEKDTYILDHMRVIPFVFPSKNKEGRAKEKCLDLFRLITPIANRYPRGGSCGSQISPSNK